MFWKKKQAEAKAKEAEPQKVKKLSPKEVIMGQIERLGAGQTLMYRLRSAPAMGIAVIELNSEHPAKGRKYVLSTKKIADDKPLGTGGRLWDSNKATDIAKWIMERDGELYSATEESVTSS